MLLSYEPKRQLEDGQVKKLLYIDRAVLSGVRLLVVHHLHEAEVTSSKGSAKERTNPVDPVVARELSGANSAAKGSNRVGRSASYEDTYYTILLVYLRRW